MTREPGISRGLEDISDDNPYSRHRDMMHEVANRIQFLAAEQNIEKKGDGIPTSEDYDHASDTVDIIRKKGLSKEMFDRIDSMRKMAETIGPENFLTFRKRCKEISDSVMVELAGEVDQTIKQVQNDTSIFGDPYVLITSIHGLVESAKAKYGRLYMQDEVINQVLAAADSQGHTTESSIIDDTYRQGFSAVLDIFERNIQIAIVGGDLADIIRTEEDLLRGLQK